MERCGKNTAPTATGPATTTAARLGLKKMEYRYVFIDAPWSLNYVVYRHFDDLRCTDKKMAETHRIATFMIEADANDYCAYRNGVAPAVAPSDR